jgi:hypothetical protein
VKYFIYEEQNAKSRTQEVDAALDTALKMAEI